MIPLLIPILFALHQVFVRIGSQKTDLNNGIFLSLLVSTVLLSPSTLKPTFNLYFISAMLFAGFLHFFIARVCFYNSIKRVGANVASTLSATRTFFAIIFGFFVGEEIKVEIVLMAFLIFFGVLLLYEPKGKFDLFGYLLAISTAIFSASSSFFVKFALQIDKNPFFGAFLGFLLSTTLMVPFIKKIELNKWFALAGVFVTLGHLVRYLSLENYPVILVEPITSSYPLFTILFSYFLAKELEIFSFRIVFGATMVVLGISLYFFL
ncbi:MAG: DMT family transporter [Archaeoglobaceae archaeon]|nr:DMT family transporter [Archaeoglobaceae archaeon]MCX8152363.1 DMT family transporter [Archaeoglobaceae archaeon]MDW8014178.1 DMT family transporter [Archaeoglobaceae archaeon]